MNSLVLNSTSSIVGLSMLGILVIFSASLALSLGAGFVGYYLVKAVL